MLEAAATVGARTLVVAGDNPNPARLADTFRQL